MAIASPTRMSWPATAVGSSSCAIWAPARSRRWPTATTACSPHGRRRATCVLFCLRARELRRFRLGDELSTTVDPLRDGFRGAAWLSDDTRRVRERIGPGAAYPRRRRPVDRDRARDQRRLRRPASHRQPCRLRRGVAHPERRRPRRQPRGRGHSSCRWAGDQARQRTGGRVGGLRPSADAPTERVVRGDVRHRSAGADGRTGACGRSDHVGSHHRHRRRSPPATRACWRFAPRPTARHSSNGWTAPADRSAWSGRPDFYGAFSLSGDGSRIVARLQPNPQRPVGGLRLIDIGRGVVSPIVTPAGRRLRPALDARRHAASSTAWPTRSCANRRLRPKPRRFGMAPLYPDALSRDGRWMLVGQVDGHGGFGLYVMSADGSGDLQALSTDEAASDRGVVLPGWPARVVQQHAHRPLRGLPVAVSADRRALAGVVGGRRAAPLVGGRPRALLRRSRPASSSAWRCRLPTPGASAAPKRCSISASERRRPRFEQYAVHGNRFLVLRPSKNSAPQTVAVVSNWTSALPVAVASAGR